MNTDELLSLQRRPSQLRHHDELLFQVVHQVHELWLRAVGWDMAAAVTCVRTGDLPGAQHLLRRVGQILRLLTDSLDPLASITPAAFQAFRPALGTGSGAQSPGWRGLRAGAKALGGAFGLLLDRRDLHLVDVYGDEGCELFQVAEALVEVDERHAAWQGRHRLLAERLLGVGMVGTAGTPVQALAQAVDRRLFPQLWRVRAQLWHAEADRADVAVSSRAGRR